MTRRIALVSAREALPLDEDMPPLVAAFAELGVEVVTPCWDDPAVDWSRFSAAVIRSTWDYVDRIGEFLPWADRCAARTRLINPPDVLRWNTDKHYLVDLARAGLPVVPTRFVEPGVDAATELQAFLAVGPDSLTVGARHTFTEVVVKPSIGAGSRDTTRYSRDDVAGMLDHLGRLLGRGASAMLQPYLERVDEQGETAVIYLGGSFSHAIRKGPLLTAGGPPVEGLFAPEQIRARPPSDAELNLAAGAFAAIGTSQPLYARIDMIRDAQDSPLVLELELTEPSLFFAHAPGSAQRFARSLIERIAG